MTARLRSAVLEVAWRVLVAFLPVTSMPLLVGWLHSDTVAAPSGLLLLFLVAAWLLPHLARRGTLPGQALPLLAFVTFALISTAGAWFLDIPPFKTMGLADSEIKALITLAIGLCFYLVSATWTDSTARLELTFRWLNWGGVAILAWSRLQAFYWYAFNRYPEWMRDLHALVSVGPFYRQRVTGFTLEPSWLAHQLNMLYLPYWLAASVRRFSAHKLHIGPITMENFLLTGGALMMFLTLSRVGQLAFLLMLGYLGLRSGMRLVRWLEAKISVGRWSSTDRRHVWLSVGVYALILLTAASILLGGAYGLSRFDRRMVEVFSFSPTDSDSFMRYANRLNFGARVAYWQAGWEVFNDHPWMGVGLGNAGFFFPQKISSFGWTFFEVRGLMYHSDSLPNTKSLWVRILAETGLVGFAFFVAWLFSMWRTSRLLQKCKPPLQQMMGLMGIFILIGLLLEGFSIDSFALPYFWLSAGLVTAAGRICYN
jgi:O-antigen ligase